MDELGPGVQGPLMWAAPANILGSSRSEYKPKRDIARSLGIGTLQKGMSECHYFGAKVKGLRDDERTATDLSDFTKIIVGRIEEDVYYQIYGGTVVDYLTDAEYDPECVLGEHYYPSEGDEWIAFIATDRDVAAHERRKATIRKWIYNVVYNFSTGFWHDLVRNSLEIQNGQNIIREWKSNFMSDAVVNVTAKAEQLRGAEYEIVGAENPAVKMTSVLEGWNVIQHTTMAPMYGVSWFAATVAMMIQNNPCYSIFRQSGDNMEKLLLERSPAAVTLAIRRCWTTNHLEWERNGTAKANANGGRDGMSSRQSRQDSNKNKSNARDRNKNVVCYNCGVPGHIRKECRKQGGGAAKASTVVCYGCGGVGHYKRDCRKSGGGDKGGAGRGRGGADRGGDGGSRNRSRVVSFDSPPCTYSQCKGNPKTHSTSKCVDKLANDRRSRAGSVNKRKAEKQNGRESRNNGAGADNHNDSDSDDQT